MGRRAAAKDPALDLREVQILEAIQADSGVSQRDLAGRFDVALGLINVMLRRLAAKGYINIVKMDAQQRAYFVTPRGVVEKTRRLLAHLNNSYEFYQMSRKLIRQSVADLERTGARRIGIYGVGDVAEMVFLALKECGLDLVCVADDWHEGGPWLGQPVLDAGRLRALKLDAVVLCTRNDKRTPALSPDEAGCPVWRLGTDRPR